jgi:H+/Cl- antiporter ClcA
MTGDASSPTGAGVISLRLTAKLSFWALLVGIAAGAAASGFVAVQHHLTHWLWHDLPSLAGFAEAPWWMVLLLPVTGGLLTFAAMRLPGGGGHSPLAGLAMNIGPKEIGSALLAALASLAFGAVLGPEAPLMAVGTAMGALAFREEQPAARQVMMIVGAMAAMGAVFGNPLITSILLLEVALAAGTALATPVILLPSLVGLASGYLLQVGVANWTGLGEAQLALPGLAAYPTVRLLDLAVAVPLAMLVSAVTIAARLVALRVDTLARRAPLVTLAGAGAVTGLCALGFMLITGRSADLVLFAGQSAMVQYLGLASLATAGTVLVAKFIAYAVCLGGGFRGGAIFPAIALGTILAVMASAFVGAGPNTALIAAAIAAATAAGMRFPFTSVLLGVLLTIAAGPATTVPAIVGAVVGMLVRLASERKFVALAPRATSETQAAAARQVNPGSEPPN